MNFAECMIGDRCTEVFGLVRVWSDGYVLYKPNAEEHWRKPNKAELTHIHSELSELFPSLMDELILKNQEVVIDLTPKNWLLSIEGFELLESIMEFCRCMHDARTSGWLRLSKFEAGKNEVKITVPVEFATPEFLKEVKVIKSKF